MIRLLISALVARNFKSSPGGVKGPGAFDATFARLRTRRQAGWLTFLPAAGAAAASSFFFARIRSEPNLMVHCATDSNRDSNTATHCSSSRSVDGGQLGRLRTIMVVVDQLSRAALQATISPYTRSGSSKGSIAS